MRAADEESFSLADHKLAEMEETDVVIRIGGARNTSETSDVAGRKRAAFAKASKPIGEERMRKRWVATVHPSPGNAQKAEMSTEAYADFVYDAVNKDWDAQREHQAQMVDILGPPTRSASSRGDDGRHDERRGDGDGERLRGTEPPGGEVYTAPRPDSVEGEVLFDKPLVRHGREIDGARLVFEDGRVVEYGADKNEDVLGEILDTDEGAKRLGELGIGMNRDIDEFTYNMLFDEKMGDTIHLAIGKAIEHTVPDGESR